MDPNARAEFRLDSISPAEVTTYATDVTLEAFGSGFDSLAHKVVWDSVGVLPTEWVSSSKLRAHVSDDLLTRGGRASIFVAAFGSSEARSDTSTLTVSNPVPVLEDVQPDTIPLGVRRDVIIVGENFVRDAVFWTGRYGFHTTFVSPGILRSTIPSNLDWPAQMTAMVVNTEPGGGASNALPFHRPDPPPGITALEPAYVREGSADFTLTIHGTNFVPESRIEWDAAPRPASFVDEATMAVMVAAEDIAAVGAHEITVANPVDRGTSGPAVLPVLASTPSLSPPISLPMVSHHLEPDPQRDLVYASGTWDSPLYQNELAAIDPSSGEVEWSLRPPGEPGAMAITEDARYLYLALLIEPIVLRIDLENRAVDLTIPTSQAGTGPSTAVDLATLPGSPRSVVAALGDEEVIVVFDDDVTRPLIGTSATRLEVASEDRLYTFNPTTTAYKTTRMSLFDGGLLADGSFSFVEHSGASDISLSGGLLYSTSGDVGDPEAMVGRGWTGLRGPIAADAQNGRVHQWVRGELVTMHYRTLQPMGTVEITEAEGSTTIVRWGVDGLALAGGSYVVFVRGSLIGR